MTPASSIVLMMCAAASIQADAKDIIVGTPPWQYKFATSEM